MACPYCKYATQLIGAIPLAQINQRSTPCPVCSVHPHTSPPRTVDAANKNVWWLEVEARQPHISLVSHTVHGPHTHPSSLLQQHQQHPSPSPTRLCPLRCISALCPVAPDTGIPATQLNCSDSPPYYLLDYQFLAALLLRPSFLTHLGGRNVDSLIGPRWSSYRIYFAFK